MRKSKVVGISLVLAIALVLIFYFAVSNSFLTAKDYKYNQSITLLGYDAIAKSTNVFGSSVETQTDSNGCSYDGCHVWAAVNFDNTINNGVVLKSTQSLAKGYGWASFNKNIDTYIKTNNLNLNISALQKLELTIDESNQMSRTDGREGSRENGGTSRVFLSDGGNEVLLFEGKTSNNYAPTSTTSSGKIILTKLDDKFVLDFNGVQKTITIPQGIYEMYVYSWVTSGDYGYSITSTETITLSNLNLQIIQLPSNETGTNDNIITGDTILEDNLPSNIKYTAMFLISLIAGLVVMIIYKIVWK